MSSKLPDAVRKLALAYIFICINYHVTVFETGVNILPEWIGYLILLSIWDDIFAPENSSKLIPVTALILSLVIWIMGLMEKESLILEIVYTLLALYDLYEVINHLSHVAEENRLEGWHEKLIIVRNLYLAITFIEHLCEMLRFETVAGMILLIDLLINCYGCVQLFNFADRLRMVTRKE